MAGCFFVFKTARMTFQSESFEKPCKKAVIKGVHSSTYILIKQ